MADLHPRSRGSKAASSSPGTGSSTSSCIESEWSEEAAFGNQRGYLLFFLLHSLPRRRQSQLIIRTYDLSDSGVYECRAKNRLTKHSANATIRVDFSHYLSPATVPGSPSPHFPSTVNPDTRPHSGGSGEWRRL